MHKRRLTAVVSDPPPSNLPRDMLLEILKRLPAKTLMKFKCVSKHWFNLIRDSSFAESHLNHARTRPDASHLLFASFAAMDDQIQTIFPTDEDLFLSSQLPSHTFGQDFQPCSNVVNGLVCVCSVLSTQPYVCVLNLTTKEKKPLPVPSLATTNFSRSIFYLGFDSVSNKYKILHHCKGTYEVLTLGTETWRRVRGNPAVDIDIVNDREGGFIYQGFGHEGIAAINGRIYIRNVEEGVIAFFDSTEEKFREVAFPESIEGVSRYTDIVDLGGKLAIVVGKNEVVSQLRIWILEDDKNWVEKRLTLPNLKNRIYVEFIGVMGNGKVLVKCKDSCLNDSPSYFLYYDLKTLERHTTCVIKMQAHKDPISCSYVENIVPL